MTKWKAEIDAELGVERKFHTKLEQQIIEKANNNQKSTKKYSYPVTIFAACLIVILLFLTWPINQPEQITQSSFVTLDERTKIASPISFYISDLVTDDKKFLARANSTILGTRKYSSKDAVQVVAQILQNAQLAENSSSWKHKDVVVKLEDDTLLKLKLYDHDTWIGILDIETKLYYVAKGIAAENMLSMYYNSEISYAIKVACFTGFITLMTLLILRNKKAKMPFSKIAPIASFVSVMLLLSGGLHNLAISIWLPITLIIATAIIQAYLLKRQGEASEISRKQIIYAMALLLVGLGITLVKSFGGFV